jgi:hypothetical protein
MKAQVDYFPVARDSFAVGNYSSAVLTLASAASNASAARSSPRYAAPASTAQSALRPESDFQFIGM